MGSKVKGSANQSVTVTTKDCSLIPELADNSLKLVTKVIDGDTFIIEGGYSVRILDIDADERGYSCYEEAKNKLEELILNKTVRLEKENEDRDQYCRYLRHIFLGDKNIGLELVKEGLAIARLDTSSSKYSQAIINAEQKAREKKIGCQWQSQNNWAINQQEQTSYEWHKIDQSLGLKIIDACQAQNYYGQNVIVEGNIADTYRSKTNTVFLNFSQPYPQQCFTAVIFSSDLNRFQESPEKYYNNKTVRIFGKVQQYQGKPEIILESPDQIEIGH